MYKYKAKLIKVVDGDTIDALIDCGFSTFKKERVRLRGINAPESRTRDVIEKEYGMMSKKYLTNKLKSAKKISIKTYKGEETGKFGRILGDVFVDGKSVNLMMCNDGYAVKYYGQNKKLVEEAHMKNRKLLVRRKYHGE